MKAALHLLLVTFNLFLVTNQGAGESEGSIHLLLVTFNLFLVTNQGAGESEGNTSLTVGNLQFISCY